MKSIRTKITTLIIIGIIVSTIVVGSVGILRFKSAMEDTAVDIINLTCSDEAQKMNTTLGRIEQSVQIMSEYAINNLESLDKLTNDKEYLETYTRELEELGLSIATKTDGAEATYVRFNPELMPPDAGFFKAYNEEKGVYENVETTDLSQYSPEDKENVGWYYTPVNAGEPTWLESYYDESISAELISYIIPVYIEDELLGVVGMDIKLEFITDIVDKIHVYETGHAFLADHEFCVAYSEHYEVGTSVRDFDEELAEANATEIVSMETLYNHSLNGVEKKVAFRPLANGMYLAVTAPVSEINSGVNQMVVDVGIMAGVIMVIFIVAALLICRSIVHPLMELNAAAKKIAEGNLDISLTCNSKDEVGTLAESLRETAKQLKIRIDYINNLAYIDKLTGVKNNTAYLHEVSFLRREIEEGNSIFSVFVIDINGLKKINDSYGHERGNDLIIAATGIMEKVFGDEPVYRIGGDEFAVILRSDDQKKCREYVDAFERELQGTVGDITVVAAIGYATYDKNYDEDYDSVFRRADNEMYKKKEEMKATGRISKINGIFIGKV